MDILFSHTLRSIKHNKAQFCVILLTITLVTTMLFVSLTIGGLFYNLNLSVKSRLGADTDVTMTGDVFSENKLDEYLAQNSDKVEYADKYLQMGGLFSASDTSMNKVVLIEATDLTNLIKRHPTYVAVGEEYKQRYEYPPVWVGRSFAEENGVKVGDTVNIYLQMYRVYQKLTVTYIMESEGIFANSTVNNVLIDFSAINNKGMLNLVNVKLVNGADAEEFSSGLNRYMANDKLTVKGSVDYDEINRIVSNNQTLLNISLIFIIALMLYILFSAYLVIMKKRTSEMVIFKSAGASPGQLIWIMLSESLIYGFFGAVLGLIVGRIGMGIVVQKVIPNFTDAVTYGASDYVLSFLAGITISVLSCVAPSVKLSKMTVRQMTSTEVKGVKYPPVLLVIILTVILAAAVTILLTVPKASVIATVILTVAVALWILAVTPYLVKGVSVIFSGCKGSARIASFGLKRNGFSRTLSALLGSIITFTFIVVAIINVIIYAVKPFNERFSSDYVVEAVQGGDIAKAYSEVRNIYGVKSAFLYRYDDFVWTLPNGDKSEYSVYGIDNAGALDGISKGVDEETRALFENSVSPVIISYDCAERYGLKKGDIVKLTLGNKDAQGQTLKGEFTVAGIDYAMTQNDRVMIIPNSKFVTEEGTFSPKGGMIFINTQPNVYSKDLYNQLRDNLEENYCYILSFPDWAYATSVGIKGVETLLKVLQYLVSAVAAIGLINLIIVMYGERKQEFGVFKAAGMDRRKYFSLCSAESVIIALSGGIIGFVLSFVVNRLMPTFALLIDRFLLFSSMPINLPIIAVALSALFVGVYIVVGAISQKYRDSISRIPNF